MYNFEDDRNVDVRIEKTKRKRQNSKISVSNIKASKYVEDPKLDQIPIVKIEMCNSENDCNVDVRNEKTKRKKQNSKISVCNIKTSKYVEDPKLNQIPKVNVERCSFENFLNKDMNSDKKTKANRTKHNSKIDSLVQQKNVRKHKGLEYFDEWENRSDKHLHPQSDKKILRERKNIDYKEKLSIGTPEINAKPVLPEGIRIPIYKQFNSTHISTNYGKHDQYDFIPDSDEDKGSDFSFHLETPAKKRKIIKMLHIPRKRVANVNNKENHFRKCKKDENIYENKIQNIVDRVKNKINIKNNTLVKNNKQILTKKIDENNPKNKNQLLVKNMKNNVINMELIFNSTAGHETCNLPFSNESPISPNKYSTRSNDDGKKNVQIQQGLNKKFVKGGNSNVQVILSHKESLISHNQEYSKENNINLNKNKFIDRNDKPLKSNSYAIEPGNALSGYSNPASNFAFDISETSKSRDDLHQNFFSDDGANKRNDVEDLFGFLVDIEDENKLKTPVKPRINIIQNIELGKSTTSKQAIQCTKQPTRILWRFNGDITRNPHFVQLKNDGLPSVNQDPVLDHTFEDRLSEIIATTSVPCSTKSLKQKSILNFVETNKEYFNENHTAPSLFDVDEFSPIKVKPVDKENSDSNRMQVMKHATRRNILGEINENIMSGKTSTPAKSKKPSEPMQIDVSLIEHEKDAEISNNFGFNSWSEIIENEKKDAVIKSKAKPFRLAVNFEPKRQPKKLPEKLIQPIRDSEVKKIVRVGDDLEFSKFIENEGLECKKVGLFEDADISQNITKCYKVRTKKKVVTTQDNPKKRDKGCKLSKEAKKWIKEFNQMCDEVENVELELD